MVNETRIDRGRYDISSASMRKARWRSRLQQRTRLP